MRNRTTVLMSIKPRYTDLIFNGLKTIELRRVCPKIHRGDIVIVYASGPRMALIGAFCVEDVITGAPEDLYLLCNGKCGVTKEEFDLYFKGSIRGYGIEIGETWLFEEARGLDFLRSVVRGFRPPQSYRYLAHDELGAFDLNGGRTLAEV